MAKEYYVVFNGRRRGIMKDWETEVKPSVDGYPGAEFLGFKTKEEASKAWRVGYDEYIKFIEDVKQKRKNHQVESSEFESIW